MRYRGWYSNRARGERAKAPKAQDPATRPAASVKYVSESVARAKAAWARLIRKVYEADSLAWPRWQGADAGDSADRRSGRGVAHPRSPGTGCPSSASEARSRKLAAGRRARLSPRTYHAVPDIA